MTPTPVGMRCPECARQRTRVHTMRSVSVAGVDATRVLIAINVLAFLASGGFTIAGNPPNSTVIRNGILYGPSISIDHQYWRLVTSAFLHANVIHIGFNMYLLYLLGQMLEPTLGRLKFVSVYFVSLLAGSLGALIATPHTPSLGASGAVFGLMGAAAVEMRARGINPMQTGIGGLIIINLILSFSLSNISVGAHVGGLIGGALAALAVQLGDRQRSQLLGLAGCLVLAAGSVGGAIETAKSSSAPPPSDVRLVR
jgi:membrane associated rhomboid family serine protease